MTKSAKNLFRENKEYEKTLSDHSREVMSDIAVYVRSLKINEQNQELVIKKVMEHIHIGELAGNSIEVTLNGDIKGYCDNLASEYPALSTTEKIYGIFDTILPLISILAGWWLIKNILMAYGGSHSMYKFTMYAGEIIAGVIIIISITLIVELIGSKVFNNVSALNKKRKIVMFILMWVAFLIVMAIVIFTLNFFRRPYFSVTLPAIMAVILVPAAIKLFVDSLI